MQPFDTDFPADSVEFCPHPQATDVFVCGTYKLETVPSRPADEDDDEPYPILTQGPAPKRNGKCIVFRVESPDELTYSPVQTFYVPAVLDMKWCHTTEARSPLLAIAEAEGSVTLHEWDFDQKIMNQTASIPCASPDVLCLSLDWSNRRSPTDTMGSLVVSLSNGELVLLRPDPAEGLRVIETWHAHDFEPWIVAWDYWDTNTVYSGGDDLKLKMWDIRQGFASPTIINKRFDAGVTTIQSHPHVEHIFAVGSYDSTVRLFDKRKPMTPLTQADVSGGVWRVKWHPKANRTHDLLVACMHDSFKIVKYRDMWDPHDPKTSTGENWEIVRTFDKHESLGYGVDWSYAEGQDAPGQTLIASASFYDHALYVWKG